MNTFGSGDGVFSWLSRSRLRAFVVFCIAVLALSAYPLLGARAQTSIDQYVPFDRPALATLQAASKKACAIWHVWRISLDNELAEKDYYTTTALNPLGENGRYFSMGGPMRERPLPRTKRSNPAWEVLDLEDDVRRAKEIGLDCFFFSLCTVGAGTNCWNKMIDAMAAARNIGDFRIVPMMDVASLKAQKVPAATVAKHIASIAKDSSLMRDKAGRIYISSTNADLIDPAWWYTLKYELTKAGFPPSLVLLFQNYANNLDELMPIIDGLGTMGVGTPMFAKNSVPKPAKIAHDAKKIFLGGIKPQDFRPKDGWYLEAGNFDTFRLSLEDAIKNGADWMVFNSWNDRYEHTEIAPSTGVQWALYDLAAYYITWFKMGVQPPITQDELYFSHRVMWLKTPYNPTKQPYAMHRPTFQWQQPDLDEIELLGFLKSPGTLRIKTDRGMNTMSAPAGITSFRIPLAPSYPEFSLVRGGKAALSVKSPFRVRNMTAWHDFLYRSGSARRATVDMVANPPLSK
jgi:hypothetical protein